MVHPEDRVKLMNTMNSAAALRREVFCSFRFFRPDGSLRHFDTHAMVEPEAHGRRDWITGVFSDVSEIVEAQQKLKHAAQRLQLALSTSKLGVWEFSLETGETRWDERMHEIYRLQQPASIPTTAEFRNLIVPEDRDAVTQAWQGMLKGGPNYRIHFRITFPNGDTRHIDAHAVVQCDEHNRPVSVIGVDSDVTELVSATAESERLREQLQQAQKMEALGTLAAGVAHDFNNLLTGINGFVDLAASSLPPGHEAADLLKQALRGAMNARDLVRRILDFSRGRGDQARTKVDLSELVRDTAPLISAALPSNVSLSIAVANEAPPVLADPGQLQQILMNLCVNGSHAIGAQLGTLRVVVSRQVFELPTAALPPNCEPGEYTCLAVTDTGCGMDEAVRKRIFEPFFTTKKAGVGTGLGLSIVRDIVTAHRGGIAVESSVGVGTTFSIYFPAMSAADLPVSKPSMNPEKRGAGQRIMVVDDEPAVAMVLRLSLQKCGFKPEVYTSPIDAWKRFAHAPDDFDLLMVDQFMPEMSGHEFIEQARRLSPIIPVMVMSGRFERSELSSNHETPDVFELEKPFEISDLISAVNHSLHRTHRAPTGEPSPL
jgi:signal transduction histidine kinase